MDKSRIRKYLIIGFIGSLITVIGEMAQGLAETVSASNTMSEMFATHASVAGWRHGFGSTVGAIGIILQFFGMYAIYLSVVDKGKKTAKLFKYGAVVYSFVGASIHILFASAIYIYKIGSEFLMEYMLWFVLPITVLFLVIYAWFSIIMFNLFRKGKTTFPKWCCVLNPLIGKGAINILSEVIPISIISNGVGYSNMGISAVIIFATLLIIDCKQKIQ